MFQAQVVKYLLEGLAVAVASHLVAGNKLDIKEIAMLGVTAAAVFAVLEYYSPSIVAGARQGAGFGIGFKMVGGDEEDEEMDEEIGAEEMDEELEEEAPLPREATAPAPPMVHVPSPNSPYKLVDGLYSHKILLAGFNEDAKAANNLENCMNMSRYPWGEDGAQVGGAATEEKSEVTAEEESAKAAGESAAKVAEGESAKVAEAPETAVATEPEPVAATQVVIERGKNYRKAGTLYSGDLIDITTEDLYLQRGTIDSQIVFDKALTKVGTNLSKLRMVNPNHRRARQTPLNYGESVYIMHNAYFNNMNAPKFVKYGEHLQSHQDGPMYRSFKVFKADNKEQQGAVEPGAEVYLARGDQEGDDIYLKVEDDKSVTSKNTMDNATRFKVTLKRVYEAHNRNLCVCSNETIYP
jgi:hypothetical protein